MTEANYDEVICPNCVTQFRAIPVNVQDQITALTAERDALKDAARLALDALDAVEIDEKHYLTKCSKAIAALKAVL